MNRSILDSVVDSKLPPGKIQRSKLKDMERSRKLAREDHAVKKSAQAAKVDEQISLLLFHSEANSRNTIRSMAKSGGHSIYTVGCFAQAMRTFDIRDDFGVIMVGLSDKPEACEEKLLKLQQRYPNVSVIGLVGDEGADWVADLVSRGLLFLSVSEPLDSSEFQKAVVSGHKRHEMLNKIQDLRENVEADGNSMSKLKGLFRKTA